MKKVKAELGGRPFANDDILAIQTELTDAVQAQFLGKGPFILSGCAVSGPATAATITEGILCLDGQLVRFYGQSGVALPAQFQLSPWAFSDPRPYQTGGTKNCMEEKTAVLVATDPNYTGGEFLPVDTWGAKTWAHVQRASVRYPTEVMPLASIDTRDFVAGVAKPGTALWGWALCDGQNGRANLLGSFIAGMDPSRIDYDTPGKTGGAESVALTIAQMPEHGHNGSFDITDDHNKGPGAGSFLAAANAAPLPNAAGRRISTGDTGGGQAHENRPPFYVLAMLQWVGY